MMSKEERKTYNANHYKKRLEKDGPEYFRDKANKRRKEGKKWFKELKSTLKCERCPESHIACLDFHHVDDNKEFTISGSINKGYSIERIKKEIEKCIVLCSNCHRKEHYKGVLV